MQEAHPHYPLFLGLLALLFVCAIGYLVLYNRRQKDALKKIVGTPHSKAEEITLEQEETNREHRHKSQ